MQPDLSSQNKLEEQALLQQQSAQPLLQEPHEPTVQQASQDEQQQQQQQQQYFYEELKQSSSQSFTRKNKKTGSGGVNGGGQHRARCCCCCCCEGRNSSSSSSRQCCGLQNTLPAEALSNKVLLNVGGRLFATTYSTLTNFGPHYLSRCLSPPWRQGETREIFIDRNGDSFSYILDFLRNGCLCCSDEPWVLQQLLLEARFFCIRPLEEEIEDRIQKIGVEEVAVRCEEADRLAAATAAVGFGRSQDCLAAFMPHDSSLRQQQLLHMNLCRDRETCSHGRRSSRSSEGGSRSGSSESESSSNVREPLTAAASAAAIVPPGESPQERAKLAQIAAAAELAARAESLRRSLVNDDPEPPEPQTVKDMGERVLRTDEDF
ncbi:potassium channel tetramerisation domain containing protein, putative [Eimeria brunetti]|uniref:Potassium channel tetramerisation domain containing protein, putative n=1 Tax=Eimeria brunetti TaxID=51314 RepID=U6L7B7_9EIME|nr:potassium channel tetramerisation domain containing protein, putative [Eimeria brunetti]